MKYYVFPCKCIYMTEQPSEVPLRYYWEEKWSCPAHKQWKGQKDYGQTPENYGAKLITKTEAAILILGESNGIL